MIIYYLHYFVVSFISSLALFKAKGEKYIIPVIFLLLFVFCALRGNVGRDYSNYIGYFTVLTGDNVNYFKEKILVYEPCNYFIPLIMKYLFGKDIYIGLTFATFAFLGVYFKIKSLTISNSFFLSILLYLTNFYLLHEMTQIRSGVATGIFLLSLKYIYERKIKLYILFILCACFFHYSSFLFLPLYYLNPNTLNRKKWGGVLLLVSVMSLLNVNMLNPQLLTFIPKIQIYLELMEQGEYTKINIWNNFGFLINILTTCFLLFKANTINPYNKYFILLLKLNIISVIIYMALASIPTLAMRGSQMIGVVQILLFPTILFCFKEKIIPYTIIFGISLIFFYNHFIRLVLFQPYYTWL